MIKILLDFGRLPQNEFKYRLEYMFKKMNGNATYSMFNPLVATLGTMITAYTAALFAVEEGGSVEEKNKLRAEYNLFLTKFAKKVEVFANDFAMTEEGMAFVKGTGFTLLEETLKMRLDFLDVPTNLIVTDEPNRKGFCFLVWKRVLGAVTYLIEALDKDGNWQTVGVSKLPKFLYMGTESEVKKTFRVRAIGPNNLMSDFTEAVSVWVR